MDPWLPYLKGLVQRSQFLDVVVSRRKSQGTGSDDERVPSLAAGRH
jgi:hypothetical protein